MEIQKNIFLDPKQTLDKAWFQFCLESNSVLWVASNMWRQQTAQGNFGEKSWKWRYIYDLNMIPVNTHSNTPRKVYRTYLVCCPRSWLISHVSYCLNNDIPSAASLNRGRPHRKPFFSSSTQILPGVIGQSNGTVNLCSHNAVDINASQLGDIF